jgi:pyruvate,water dikinase
MSQTILKFDDPLCCALNLAGGKGANLGRLTQAGFAVPPGFCIAAPVYAECLTAAGLDAAIAQILESVDYSQPAMLEDSVARIRGLIEAAEMPAAIAGDIAAAYQALGADIYVAVRSSGTAEDLAEASFAGMHDTYLDMRGAAGVIDAVKRCWASLWTARATAYRHDKGFDHLRTRLAVVVQTMVESEVSGVMFTANPMTAETSETVINASWGLGEAIVQGIATPDEYIIKTATMKILERRTGAKEVRIVRDRSTGAGTITQTVPQSERDKRSLSDSQAATLARLGRAVTEYYDGFPQDIEWALADGKFYLLQSRPVTGIDFAWDSDADGWQRTPEDTDVIWTRAMADEVWTGAVTPLMYSWRAYLWQLAHEHLSEAWELGDASKMWFWKYHKGEAYYNTTLHQRIVERACPPPFRPVMAGNVLPNQREAAVKAPFDYLSYLRKYGKMQAFLPKEGFLGWYKEFEQVIPGWFGQACCVPDEQLRNFSDHELRNYIDEMIEFEGKFYINFWVPFWIYGRDSISALVNVVTEWYDGANKKAIVELMTGVPKRTITMEENLEIWDLAESIRQSPEVYALFKTHEGAAFFAQLEHSKAGRAFKEKYTEFLNKRAHRGHADRDMYFPRRCEDPNVDYRTFKVMLTTAGMADPHAREEEINRRREVVAEEVAENIRKKPFGAIKAEVFKYVLDYALKFLMARDNERFLMDRTTFSIKLGYLEINRRLRERGLFDSDRDFYFLTRQELYDVMENRVRHPALVKPKIAARMRNFDRFNAKQTQPPMYIQRGKAIDLSTEDAADISSGVLRGAGTSGGTYTGRARVVKSLDEIGAVQSGEILVCNSTDPGWTPVFIVIKGLVLETGGMLAHGSCLSREYGIPAVQVAGAISHIPDGALLTVNGDTGIVTIHPEDPDSVVPDHRLAA